MNKARIAIIGYGNIGRAVQSALSEAPDLELAGIVRRRAAGAQPKELADINITDNIDKLGHVDAAILCTPSRSVSEHAAPLLRRGISCVDSYDIHSSIFELKTELSEAAREGSAAAIISAGWDPGSDSVVRALMQAMAPLGITNTNFGPGMSMGHTVAVKAVPGVKKALSMTLPKGDGLHRRAVYVELDDGADFAAVEKAVKNDPYFIHDETYVKLVPSVDALLDVGHGVRMERKGVSGTTHNQLFEFNMRINNPALTGQVLVSCARAVLRQAPGAYTMIEIPVIDLLPGDREKLIRSLV